MYPKTPLKDLVTIKTGKLDANAMVIGGKYPFFTCAREIYQIDDYAFDGESILVAGNGDLNVKYYNGKFNAYQRTYVLQDFNGVDGKYLYYVIEDNLAILRSGSRGSTIKYIRLGDLQKIQIPLPPLPTQKLIVSEIEKQFSRLDEGLDSLNKTKQNLKKYKASILKSAVEGKLTKEWRDNYTKDPESSSAGQLLKQILDERKNKFLNENPKKKYKEPEPIKKEDLLIIELPEGWEWCRLDNLGELGRGKSKHRPRNDQKLFGGKYPFIQTGEVTNSNGKITEFTKTYSEFGLSQSKLWKKGTLCITIAANIAYTGFLTFDACFPDSVVGFETNDEFININFIDIYLKNIRKELDRYAPATAQKNINLEILNKLPIPLPPLQEQNEIVKIVESKLSVVEKLEKIVDENIKKANNLKQSILKKAFEGELVRED